jgi:acyl-CoA thioesterase-1
VPRWIRLPLLLGLLLLAAPPAAGATVVLCLGDSLTEGYGVDPQRAWPALVERRLHELGRGDVRLVNAGISGATSASAVSRLRWQLRGRPDVLILALGANDGLRGLDLEQTRRNLAEAIALAKRSGLRVLLAGMKIPPNYGPEYTSAFERLFPELAEREGVALIPFLLEGVAADPRLNLPDGMHPNEAGYERVAETVLERLLPLL